jgi:hypothetical protein
MDEDEAMNADGGNAQGEEMNGEGSFDAVDGIMNSDRDNTQGEEMNGGSSIDLIDSDRADELLNDDWENVSNNAVVNVGPQLNMGSGSSDSEWEDDSADQFNSSRNHTFGEDDGHVQVVGVRHCSDASSTDAY